MTTDIPVLLSTGSLFNFDVDTAMGLAADSGYDGIELMVDWRRETQDASHLLKLINRHNLPILAIHNPFVTMTLAGWAKDPVASIKQSVTLAEAVGAKTVVVHPPGRWLRLQTVLAWPHKRYKISLPLPVVGIGRLGQWLIDQLPAFQATTAVKITIENMPCRRLGRFILEPHHWTNAADLNRFSHLTFDTTHVGTRQGNLLAFYQQLQPRIAHIHLSNYNGRQHQLPFNGLLPLKELLRQLVKDKFKGMIALELNPNSLHAENWQRLTQNLQLCLEFCKQSQKATSGS